MKGHIATYSPEDDKIRIYLSYRLPADEYAPIKAAGYHSAPRQNCVFAFWSPAAEDMALELCDEIGDEDKSLVQRAEDRAERFEDYSASRKEDAERAHAAVSAIADNIPLGQPILVGHHSERHARKDAERIENGMRKAVNMWKTSQYWTQRAAGAISNAKYKELPQVRARRIKTLEAALRKEIASYTPLVTKERPAFYAMQQRWNSERNAEPIMHVLVGPPGRGGHMAAVEDLPARKAGCARYEEHLMNRLEYEHAMLEEQGAEKLLDRKPKSAKAMLPLCNYRAEGGLEIENNYRRGEMLHYDQVSMLQAEYAKIPADYKGTRVVGNSHRVRTAVIHSRGYKNCHVCVFLTDSKVHAIPAAVEPQPKPAPVERLNGVRVNEIHIDEVAPFDVEGYKDVLKKGVQVVTAPQLFPTPPAIARQVVDLAGSIGCIGKRILEPSAGTGNLIRAIVDSVTGFDCVREIVAIDISRACCDRLKDMRSKYVYANDSNFKVHQRDFLDCTPDELGLFDVIVMNPPFSKGEDIKHIQHALKFLKPDGRLVAICANGPRQQDKLQADALEWVNLPAGSFEDSGTSVNTAIVVLEALAETITL